MSVHLVASDIKRGDKPTLFRLPFSMYPDNSPVLSMEGGIPTYVDGYIVKGMMVKYHTYAEFTAAMMLAYRINWKNKDSQMRTLYLPYLPAARQDKYRPMHGLNRSTTGDILPTLDFTVELIKLGGFERVIVMDPHSNLSDPIFEELNIQKVDTTKWIPKIFARAHFVYDGVIAPDKGATQRALAFAMELGVPLYTASKERDPQTNALSGFKVNNLHPNEHYLVVDDICDGGGTFMGIAAAIKEAGATASLFVTHGLFTHGADEKLRREYIRVYATDSLGYNADHATLVPMVEECMQLEGAEYLTIEEGKR